MYDKVPIYCALLAHQCKAKYQVYLCVSWEHLILKRYCSIARLDSLNRKFIPILNVTEVKMLICLCANELGLPIKGSEIL